MPLSDDPGENMTVFGRPLARRDFLKFSALGSSAVALQFPLNATAQAVADAVNDVEVRTWSSCTVNCGSRCPLRVVSKNGQVIRIEPDNTGVDGCATSALVPHVRACVRGR
ncbi:MAG: twin-arginine translocation signal domain-containing protein, partial [Burkholderiaceae bacterium]